MTAKVIRCHRCNRRARGAMTGWNANLVKGVIIDYLCPNCQTPAEDLEAQVNEATTTYLGADQFGRIWGRRKVSEAPQ